MGLPASEPPRAYWRPALGRVGVTPSNIGLLTPGQLYEAVLAARRA